MLTRTLTWEEEDVHRQNPNSRGGGGGRTSPDPLDPPWLAWVGEELGAGRSQGGVHREQLARE